MKRFLKYAASLMLIGVIAIGGIYLGLQAPSYLSHNSPSSAVLSEQVSAQTPAPAPIVIGTPVALSVPKIGVNTNVESLGMDSQGRMDVPQNSENVGWYNLGFKPGEKGSAVIDGHLDTPYGPAVFAGLATLASGDQIYVTDSNGKQFTFVVTQTASYPWNQLPMEQIFNSTDKARLNLITCGGTWNSSAHNYSNRIVVYSELQSSAPNQ